MKRMGRAVLAANLSMMTLAAPAHAWIPIGGGEKPKLEIETRFMFWGVSSGEELGAAVAVPPQAENVQDFLIRRARVLFRYRPTDSLELYLQAGQDNYGAKIVNDEAGFRVKDFYVNWKALEPFQVTAGQFKVPFLRQNLESGFNQLLVDRTVVTALRPARDGSRDVGVMGWGNAGGFQYRAALFDGSDQEDLNSTSSPRGSGRIAWNWGARETGLSYSGTTVGKSKLLQLGLQADVQSDRVDPLDLGFTTDLRDYGAWAFDAYFDCPFGEGWAVTAEGAWIERRDDYQDPMLGSRYLDAFYFQAGLLLPMEMKGTRLQVAGRLDSLDSHRPSARAGSKAGTLGLSWFIKGHDQKIQLDYTHRTEQPKLDNDVVRLSLVMVF